MRSSLACLFVVLVASCQASTDRHVAVSSDPEEIATPPRELIKLAFAAEMPTPRRCAALPDLLPPAKPASDEEWWKMEIEEHNRHTACSGYLLRDGLEVLRDALRESDELVREAARWNEQEVLPPGSETYSEDLDRQLSIQHFMISLIVSSISNEIRGLQLDSPHIVEHARRTGLPFLSGPDVFETFKREIPELQVRAQTMADRLDEQEERLMGHGVSSLRRMPQSRKR